ncbi:choice-of-anchor A family protein [Myxococcus sp. MISCRS1]|uniref:choice-of-anchor A family protein n=1 Tax=unclassified Myxococcus TaxID=2648731 RepID=UPI001CBE9676|nr:MULTISPECIES: choice-of-anchor A family protein [unclassified Myxococcus]MBZ4394555.1 choice-of-anchor A family protein [Myxococcus sp. AS-1-15]MCY1001527.1 choice-of-anchor A family protein [Myxococcus sp. MISCRS1]
MQPRNVPLLPLVLALALACGDASPPEASPPQQQSQATLREEAQRAERRRIASRQVVQPAAQLAQATAPDLAAALDIPAGMLVSSQLTAPAPDQTTKVMSNYGIITPRKGPSLIVLGTGYVNDRARLPEPGTDFAPEGAEGDVVTLRLTLNVPAGMTRLSFDYRFLSAESPDFVGSEYNDQFTAHVQDAQGTRLAEQTSVNSAHFFDASATRAKDTQFDVLLADDPSGVDFFPATYPDGIQLFPDAGITDFKTVNVAIAGGGPVTLVFEIRDLGDGILDSSVVIDNVSISSLEKIDPNPILIDPLLRKVETNPGRLATLGTPASGVAADGVSVILLRARLPGPGTLRFKLGDTHLPANGGLSLVGSSDAPTNVIDATAQQVATNQYYAFALYTAPEDFIRPGQETADRLLKKRAVTLSTLYTPANGTPFPDTHEIEVVRPPIVAIHDLWSDCQYWEWHAGISSNILFDVTCADYSTTSSESIDSEANRAALGKAIREALLEMRLRYIAVTQVDALAHGMGGIMARRFAARSDYLRADNFNKGDLNRLILLNTPHAGSAIAKAIVDTRNHMKGTASYQVAWDELKLEMLRDFNVSLEVNSGTTSFEDLQPGNPLLTSVGVTNVPTHVLVSLNGKNIERPQGQGMLFDHIKVLYTNMEAYHPLVDKLTPPANWNLIMRAKTSRNPQQAAQPSRLFCDKDYDMFASEADQRGGAPTTATTSFAMDASVPDLEHFKTPSNTSYYASIVNLLNSPVASDSFAPSLPAPVAATNCPPPDAGGGGAWMPDDEQLAPEEEPLPVITGWERPSPLLASGGMRIVSPAPGTAVSPGSTLTVVTEGTGGFAPHLVYVSSTDKAVVIPEAPFTTTFQVPPHAIGTVQLVATGIDDARQRRSSPPVSLQVVSSAQLNLISVLNGDGVLHGVGSTRNLVVTGLYNDGIKRDITSQAVGTVYSSSNEAIATVSTAGVVTAQGPGIATIVIRNGPAVTSISVTVVEQRVEHCIQVRLADYNLLVAEDYRQGNDVAGRVAAGGSIFLKDFRVGWNLPDTDTDNLLVAGRDLNLNNGTVWGHARFGDRYLPAGTLTFPRGSVTRGTPIPFTDVLGSLRKLSADLAALPQQGTTTLEPWGGIFLRGTHPKVNVFHVQASAIASAALLTIEAPATSLVVINVRGTSPLFTNFGHVFAGGIDEHGVLFNLPEATTLTAFDYGFYGTVLAPHAHVSFSDGAWVGGLYARSMTGNAVGHLGQLRDSDICR